MRSCKDRKTGWIKRRFGEMNLEPSRRDTYNMTLLYLSYPGDVCLDPITTQT